MNQLQFSKEGNLIYLERTMTALEEAHSLFRSMNYRFGIIETERFKARLTNGNDFLEQSHVCHKSEIKQGSPSLSRCVAGIQKTVYRKFSAYVSSHESGTIGTLINQPLNHN